MRAFSLARLVKSVSFISFLTCFVSLQGSSNRSPRYFGEGVFVIRAESLSLSSLGVIRAQTVPLQLIKAWRLTANHPAFGGLSALDVKGQKVEALNDVGGRLNWTINQETAWDTRLSVLPKGCGDTASHFDRDTESLVLDRKNDQRWIGFEVRNAICRMSPDGSAVVRAPTQMRNWPKTGGPEALVRLSDGRFLVFAESTKNEDEPLTPLFVFDGDPVLPRAVVRQLSYHAPPGTRPVDAAQLPDGRLLILNRRFEFPFRFSVVLSLADPTLPQGQTVLDSQPIAWFGKGLSADNWEAISIEDLGKGHARIWMVSDNNFMGIQNTLLLKLNWQGEAALRAQ